MSLIDEILAKATDWTPAERERLRELLVDWTTTTTDLAAGVAGAQAEVDIALANLRNVASTRAVRGAQLAHEFISRTLTAALGALI